MSKSIAMIFFCAFALFSAQAHSRPIITCNQQGCSDWATPTAQQSNKRASARPIEAGSVIVGGRPAGCPRRYCGCGVSLKVFGKIVPELNLAYNWKRKFPRTSPAPGMVAARSGHVFYIKEVIDHDTVIAYDPNSGNGLTRIHERSLRGYTVVNPHGSLVMN